MLYFIVFLWHKAGTWYYMMLVTDLLTSNVHVCIHMIDMPTGTQPPFIVSMDELSIINNFWIIKRSSE